LFLSVTSVRGETEAQETVVAHSIGNNSKPSNLRRQRPNVFPMCIPVLDLWSEKVKDRKLYSYSEENSVRMNNFPQYYLSSKKW
jgi:hypothetical protein